MPSRPLRKSDFNKNRISASNQNDRNRSVDTNLVTYNSDNVDPLHQSARIPRRIVGDKFNIKEED